MKRFVFSAAVLLAASAAFAAPTTVVVRATSRDAKVIGDGVGGARITIRNLETSAVLASGIQTGGTGDTKRIMQDPRVRNGVVYATENAASFRATIDLEKPTRVEVIAEGPLKYPQATQRVSKTMLLVPGRNLEGEGVLLEIPGFIVDVLSPATAASGTPVPVRVKVVMTCGCPTEPGGMWNADDIRVTARALRADGSSAAETTLRFSGQVSTYEGAFSSLPAGAYEVEVLAVDAKTENAGRATYRVQIGE